MIFILPSLHNTHVLIFILPPSHKTHVLIFTLRPLYLQYSRFCIHFMSFMSAMAAFSYSFYAFYLYHTPMYHISIENLSPMENFTKRETECDIFALTHEFALNAHEFLHSTHEFSQQLRICAEFAFNAYTQMNLRRISV